MLESNIYINILKILDESNDSSSSTVHDNYMFLVFQLLWVDMESVAHSEERECRKNIFGSFEIQGSLVLC